MEIKRILCLLCLGTLVTQLQAGQSAASAPPTGSDSATPASSGSGSVAQVSSQELQQLREKIAQQEQAIEQLQQSVQQQQQLLDRATQSAAAASAAPSSSATAEPPPAGEDGPAKLVPVANVAHPRISPVVRGGQHNIAAQPSSLSISIGNTSITPLGFIDATFFARSTNTGTGIGSNFATIPYNNSAAGRMSETNFSLQNSRLGFRVDSSFLGYKILGYFEGDFLGNNAPNSFVTSNSNTYRLRNFFVDAQKGSFEFLGGQDWSLFTPNRKGLSPLPSDIFTTQDMDTNYNVGFWWARQAQFRFIAHPSEHIAFGASLENPQQYTGSFVAFPSAFSANLSSSGSSSQFNNGSTAYSAPNVAPDIIFKAAYDGNLGGKHMHAEAGALIRNFRDSLPFTPSGVPATSSTPGVVYHSDTVTGVTGEVNANLELFKNFHLIMNTFFGAGGGRYLQGNGPDVVVRADGTISPVHTYATLDGFEANVTKNTLISVLYGGDYFSRNSAIDANGKYIGYGYAGSPNSNNRNIQEITFDIVRTLWKSPNYGALSLIGQYSYLFREPWYVPAGGAKNARTNMYYMNLRYTLP